MIIPRPYQYLSVKALYDYFGSKDGNPIIVAPTGTGKSIIIAEFIRTAFQKYSNQRFLMLTHVKELIQQNYNKVKDIWPDSPIGIYSAGLKRKEFMFPIIFAGIGSVAKKAHLFQGTNIIIVDECHLISNKASTQYVKFINAVKKFNPDLKIIGLTATPFRLGQGLLTDGKIFDDICYDLTTEKYFEYFVKHKWMAPLITKKTNLQINTDNIKISGGEFVKKELQKEVNKTSITIDAIKETIEHGKDRKAWLIFTAGIDHANSTSKILNSFGVKADVLHSKVKNGDEILAKFKRGELKALVNVDMLTTGFDYPEIDLICCLRPTISTALWIQLLGRGTRPCKGKKNCLVLDFAGNTKRLGQIDNPVLPKKRQGRKGTAPVKTCEKCSTYNHTKAKVCISCGHEFHEKIKIKQLASNLPVMGKQKVKDEDNIIQWLPVNSIYYARHEKEGKIPSMKVTYVSGLRSFSEWICFEHNGFPRRKANMWWNKFSVSLCPKKVEVALNRVDNLKKPKMIKVWLNKRFPEIIDYLCENDITKKKAYK